VGTIARSRLADKTWWGVARNSTAGAGEQLAGPQAVRGPDSRAGTEALNRAKPIGRERWRETVELQLLFFPVGGAGLSCGGRPRRPGAYHRRHRFKRGLGARARAFPCIGRFKVGPWWPTSMARTPTEVPFNPDGMHRSMTPERWRQVERSSTGRLDIARRGGAEVYPRHGLPGPELRARWGVAHRRSSILARIPPGLGRKSFLRPSGTWSLIPTLPDDYPGQTQWIGPYRVVVRPAGRGGRQGG
jgi:hypothetical protein